MSDRVPPVPTDRPNLGPYITVSDGGAAIEFYRRAFGAEEIMRMAEPGGRVGHAELRIGNAVLMVSDEFPEYGAVSPKTLGGSPAMLHLYVDDVDAVVARAVEAGAEVTEPVADQFYGDRGGKLLDPFGHKWWIASRVEEVPEDEMMRRAKELYGMS
jgi:PhnB protein